MLNFNDTFLAIVQTTSKASGNTKYFVPNVYLSEKNMAAHKYMEI